MCFINNYTIVTVAINGIAFNSELLSSHYVLLYVIQCIHCYEVLLFKRHLIRLACCFGKKRL